MMKNMYMLSKKNIIICKFNLNNKFKFQHLTSNKINDIIAKLEDLKLDNKSLKLELKEVMIKKSNQTNTHCDVTNDKSENEKSQCRRLNRSSSQKDTGK
jgi:hypothetical protein